MGRRGEQWQGFLLRRMAGRLGVIKRAHVRANCISRSQQDSDCRRRVECAPNLCRTSARQAIAGSAAMQPARRVAECANKAVIAVDTAESPPRRCDHKLYMIG